MWIGAAAALILGIALLTSMPLRKDDSVRPVGGPVEYVPLTNFTDSATQPALSPDGRMMAFIRGPETFIGAGQIYLKLLPSGDPVQLTNDKMLKMAPHFSADGTKIVYSTLGSGWDTWFVPVIGAQPPRLFLSNAEGLTWFQQRNANGTSEPRVLFSELTGKGVTMAIVTSTESRSEQRIVYVEDGIMDHFSYLSPDGKQLLLAEMGFNGWLPCRRVPFDGSSKGNQIGPMPGQCTGAAWSKDGNWMYFAADAGNGFHIWRQRFPNGTLEQVTSGATEEEGIEFDPDGRSFLTSIGIRQSTLWLHDSKGDRQVTSEGYAFLPSFSADNRKLFYLVREAGGRQAIRGGLWTMDLASGERRRLLPDYFMEHYRVSGDGQRVLFVDATDSARSGVWLAQLDGRSAPRRITMNPGLTAFFGAPGEIIFAAQEPTGTFIYRTKESGADVTKVMLPDSVYFLYDVSPDGKFLAAWTKGISPETLNSVWLYSLNGGPSRMICTGCGNRSSDEPPFVNWSADGNFVYISIWRSATFAVPLRAGEVIPPLPAKGIGSMEDAQSLAGAKAFPVPAAFVGTDPSVYAYPKLSGQRNIYRVPVH
jgi:Tol biopolymer transport system component